MRASARSFALVPISDGLGFCSSEILEDRYRLADHGAVVELERGQLAAGILVGVGCAPVLGAENVELLGRDRHALLGENIRSARGFGPNEP